MSDQARANSTCADNCVNLDKSKYTGGACNNENHRCECREKPQDPYCHCGDLQQMNDACDESCFEKGYHKGFCLDHRCNCLSE